MLAALLRRARRRVLVLSRAEVATYLGCCSVTDAEWARLAEAGSSVVRASSALNDLLLDHLLCCASHVE